ncbi:MAG: L,D-transpeptidase [Rhizobiales bacterium]|jgi:lipoprotein-anchoring transpeptidase ErfK/SrfK|nr:L,D-transpeptidase [Hyphomicrobiales bacterium]
MKHLLAAAAVLAALAMPANAQNRAAIAVGNAAAVPPSIVVTISVPKQELRVVVDGVEQYVWPVSTAKLGALTPAGTFKVQSMNATAISRLFNNAPMPWAIFYDGHYAIHGTTSVSMLGRPASMGCTRLHPDNAKILFEMVKARGAQSLQVVVVRDDMRISSTSLVR